MRLGVGLDVHVDDVVLRGSARRPQLLAVDDVMVAVAHRGRPHRPDVRAGIGLRHRDRELDLAGQQLRQPMALLLLGSLMRDVEAAEDAAAISHAEIGARPRQFLRDDRHVDRVAAKAAVFLGKRHREQPGLDPFGVERIGVRGVAVEPAHVVRRRVPRHQLLHRFAEHRLLVAEAEIHHQLPETRINWRRGSPCRRRP
jgi:hypothetical protein